MSQRDTSRRKMESRIEEAEGYLKVLRAKVKREGAEIQEGVEERIPEQESWARSARRRRGRAGSEAAGAGKEALDDLEGRWERIRGSVEGLLSGLGGGGEK